MASLVIFDCDGVLIESEVVAARIQSEELAKIGYPITESEIIKRFAGSRGMHTEIERDMGRPLPDGYHEGLIKLIDTAFETELEACPGVHETLDAIERPMCVASSSSPRWIEKGLRATGLFHRLDPHIFSADIVGKGKPAPDIFLHAAQEMGHHPEDCIVIEDSENGVKAGIAAGMPVIGYVGGGHCLDDHAEQLTALGAHTIIDDMRALLPLLADT